MNTQSNTNEMNIKIVRDEVPENEVYVPGITEVDAICDSDDEKVEPMCWADYKMDTFHTEEFETPSVASSSAPRASEIEKLSKNYEACIMTSDVHAGITFGDEPYSPFIGTHDEFIDIYNRMPICNPEKELRPVLPHVMKNATNIPIVAEAATQALGTNAITAAWRTIVIMAGENLNPADLIRRMFNGEASVDQRKNPLLKVNVDFGRGLQVYVGARRCEKTNSVILTDYYIKNAELFYPIRFNVNHASKSAIEKAAVAYSANTVQPFSSFESWVDNIPDIDKLKKTKVNTKPSNAPSAGRGAARGAGRGAGRGAARGAARGAGRGNARGVEVHQSTSPAPQEVAIRVSYETQLQDLEFEYNCQVVEVEHQHRMKLAEMEHKYHMRIRELEQKHAQQKRQAK